MKIYRKNGLSPTKFSYTDYIPGYDAGDNPLDDITSPPESNPPNYEDPILPGGRPPMPPAQPPTTVPIDPGLGGGDSSSGFGPDILPSPIEEPVPVVEEPVSAIKDFRLIGGIAIFFLGGLILKSYRK